MGIGEPLANLRGLLPALEHLNEKEGLGIGARRITISTVGLPDKIRNCPVSESPTILPSRCTHRMMNCWNRLVPVNDKIGIEGILQAADEYFDSTGRRVSYEYVLLGMLNDSPQHARELGRLLNLASPM